MKILRRKFLQWSAAAASLLAFLRPAKAKPVCKHPQSMSEWMQQLEFAFISHAGFREGLERAVMELCQPLLEDHAVRRYNQVMQGSKLAVEEQRSMFMPGQVGFSPLFMVQRNGQFYRMTRYQLYGLVRDTLLFGNAFAIPAETRIAHINPREIDVHYRGVTDTTIYHVGYLNGRYVPEWIQHFRSSGEIAGLRNRGWALPLALGGGEKLTAMTTDDWLKLADGNHVLRQFRHFLGLPRESPGAAA